MNEVETLWRQYSMQVDLYKHYLKITIEFNVFYYAITGAIVSYYFAHSSEPHIQYSLLLPIIMSFLFSGFFFYGSVLMKYSREEVFEIRDKLGFSTAPELNVLRVLLWIFSALMIFVSIGLASLMYWA